MLDIKTLKCYNIIIGGEIMNYKTANINSETHREFKIFCSKRGVKMVDALEKAIKQYIEKESEK